MKLDFLGYVIIFFIVVVCLKMYQDSDMFNLKCIISTVDGNKYCVRERARLEESADMLAKITNKMKKLVKVLGEKYPDRENVKRMVSRFKPEKVSETLPTSEYTAYSENKGEKLAFCLNTTKKGTKLIDENTLTFVALHELSHIATESVGHKDTRAPC
jgi:translation initiation factor IF-1